MFKTPFIGEKIPSTSTGKDQNAIKFQPLFSSGHPEQSTFNFSPQFLLKFIPFPTVKKCAQIDHERSRAKSHYIKPGLRQEKRNYYLPFFQSNFG